MYNDYALYLLHRIRERPLRALGKTIPALAGITGARYALGPLLCRTDVCWPPLNLWMVTIFSAAALLVPFFMACGAFQHHGKDMQEFLSNRARRKR